ASRDCRPAAGQRVVPLGDEGALLMRRQGVGVPRSVPASIAPHAPRTIKAKIQTTMLATAAPQNPKKPSLKAVPAETTIFCCAGALTTGTGSQLAPSQR